MKKFAKIFAMIAVCFVCVLGFTACGKPKDNPIVSALVKSGLETSIVKNEQLETSDVVVTVKYKDGTTKDVSATDLEFSTVDTTTIGNKTLTITYKDYSFDVTIKVVANQQSLIPIMEITSDLVTKFNDNKKSDNGELIRFEDGSQDLLAGQQNTFHFNISATGLNDDGTRRSGITEFDTEVKVEILRDSAWVEISGAQLEEYVLINTIGAKFNFKEKAIGEKFRITVKALNVQEGTAESQVSFTQEIKVVDAFNVYTAKDLCVFDNARGKGVEDSYDWSSFKQANGYEGITVKGMVLQSEIEVTSEDVPSEVFWQAGSDFNTVVGMNLKGITKETLAGTPRDKGGRGIYTRIMSDGEEFNFYGNYFAVNLKNFPKMLVDFDILDGETKNHFASEEAQSMMTAHLCLFYTGKLDNQTIVNKTSSAWSNIAFYGNGGLELGKTYENSGGLLLMKNDAVNFTAENTVTNNFYIGYFMQRGDSNNSLVGNYEIKNCRGFNSYQCLFYFWGAKNVKIVNSTFKNAGGPAIIADHVDPDENENYPTGIDIINSTIESKVKGDEPWFGTYGAGSLVANIFALNAGFAGESRDVVTREKSKDPSDNNEYNYINLVLVYKSSANTGVSSERVHGYARIFENMNDYNSFYSTEDPQKTTYGLDLDAKNHISGRNYSDVAMSSFDASTGLGNLYFEDSKTGKYTDAGSIQGSGDPYSATVGNRISAQTKYMNVYIFNGMGAILGTFANN